MLDRLLGNPIFVITAGMVIALLALLWYRHDSHNNRIARLKRGEPADEWLPPT